MIDRQWLFGGVLWLGMAGAGVLLQLWLCPVKKTKQDAAKQILNEGNKKWT